MNLIISNNFEFGQKLYRLSCRSKNVYKPCTLCKNTRKVIIEDPDNGMEYSVPCPKCEGRQIKGDDRYYISVNSYYMEVLEIDSIVITRNEIYAKLSQGAFNSIVHLMPDDSRTVLVEKKMGFGTSNTTYYVNRSDCAAEMRRLNRIEKDKVAEFLGGGSDE
mgnify:CR=1 FL=1